MINSGRSMAPRGGARPVGVRHMRHKEWRRRTDAQARVEDVSAGVRDGRMAGSLIASSGRSEVNPK